MVGLCCAATSGSFHLLSLGVLYLFHLCANMASSTQYSDWRQMTHQFSLHPGISCPLVMFFHYTIILPDSYDFFRAIVCKSCIYCFLFPVQLSFSPFSQALLCLISCPSKTPYPTPAAGLPHPIFNFPPEIMYFLPFLLHPRCLPALPHPPFQPSPTL